MSKQAKRPKRKRAKSQPVKGPSGEQQFAKQLSEIVKHLRRIQSAARVSVGALRHQNCELDLDIAATLGFSVVDQLEDQIERLESLGGFSQREKALPPEDES